MRYQTRLMTSKQLVAVLKDIIDSLEQNDSMEGRISYTCFNGEEHEEIPIGQFEVNAFYRVGNSTGQGGSRTTLHTGDSRDA